MTRKLDLVVVGMGSGGLVAAEFAARTLGLRVAAVERGRLGGDCLWTGCVPSKALLASARVAHAMRHADRYGLEPADPGGGGAAVWDRIRAIQEGIAGSDDDPERYRAMGVRLLTGDARFAGPHAVEVDGRRLDTRFALVTSGSRPAVPPIPGLEEVGYLTNETIFDRERSPPSIAILGGGPVGVELAQALCRLGCEVSIVQRGPSLLPRDEPELVELLAARLRAEGVEIHTGASVERASSGDGTKVLHGRRDGREDRWAAEEILVAAGRSPNVESLALDRAGVRTGPRGIEVDDRLRTSARSIYAAGDVAGRFRFTHSAAFESVTAVRNMFFPGSQRAPRLVPWCTFTDPELAHAGLTAAEAVERHGRRRVEVRRIDLSHSDRARAESADAGRLVLVTARGKLVGAHALAPAAGELIHELALAIRRGMRLDGLTSLVHVYPTMSTSTAQLAGEAAYAQARRFRLLTRLGRVLGR